MPAVYHDYYDIFPGILPADATAEITVKPRFRHAAFPALEHITVSLSGSSGYRSDGSWGYNAEFNEAQNVRLDADGSLRITARFPGEQQFVLTIDTTESHFQSIDTRNQRHGESLRFHLFSLKPDLYALRPYKGDFHLHSRHSDGQLAPECAAARYRAFGMDFLAISDHFHYEPSIETMAIWEKLGTDLRLYPGEEVHTPDNQVHVLHFGGDHSVNDLFRRDEARYRREVAAIAATLGEVTPGLDPFPVAASEWAFTRIREAGGLAVFCHPYWMPKQFDIGDAVLAEILKRRKFDAVEVMGGHPREQWFSNVYMAARYAEEAARGNLFPVVGVSDAHTVDGENPYNFAGWYWTLVFAPTCDLPDLIAAMRAGQCVAAMTPKGDMPHLVGPARLVRYAGFLLDHYFPRHNQLCEIEGRLMAETLAGNDRAHAALGDLSGEVEAHRRAYFGDTPA